MTDGGREAPSARALEAIVRTNPIIDTLLRNLSRVGLPFWYLGAGAVAQTVWNLMHGFSPVHGIDDYDVVYFDPGDLSPAAESDNQARVAELAGPDVSVDVTNEARVHTWYEHRFGKAIAPYRSAEDAIATWPTTATSVGIRAGDGFVVCAPFGLADLFAMIVRPNTALVDRTVYEAKAERWQRLWPRLTVLPWPSEATQRS